MVRWQETARGTYKPYELTEVPIAVSTALTMTKVDEKRDPGTAP